MDRRALTVVGLVVLALGMVASALLGPLGLGRIVFRVSAGAERQLLGGEVVSLLVAAPLALVAALLWWRAHRLAAALTIGPAIYAVYTYTQYVIGPDYARYPGNSEQFFPLYVGLILLGGALAVGAWQVLDAAPTPTLAAGWRRGLAGLLIGLNGLFALTWLASIGPVLAGRPGAEYQADPTLFWLVRLMDLAAIIPVALVAAVGLWRATPWASRLVLAVVSFQSLEIAAVAAMAGALQWHGDPTASPVLLMATSLFTLLLAGGYGWLLRTTPDHPPASPGRLVLPNPAPRHDASRPPSATAGHRSGDAVSGPR